MKKLLPILLAIIGVAAGVGAGVALKPAPEEHAIDCGPTDGETHVVEAAAPVPPIEDPEAESTHEYVKLANQFVVPIIDDDRVGALVVMSINVEVVAGFRDKVFEREPKLRSEFLQVLFDHANAGGFEGVFTSSNNKTIIENSLLEAARRSLGNSVTDVLIIDLIRQDT